MGILSDFNRFFGIPASILPEIKSSAEIYGQVGDGALQGIRIAGVSTLDGNFH
jgi:glycerol kinase